MSAHRSAPIEQIEVITRGARRRWSIAEKRSIVAASLVSGVTVSEFCRRHEIHSGQLSTWRRQYRNGELDGDLVLMPQFARAVVADVAPGPTGPASPADVPPPEARPAPRRRRSRGAARTAEAIEVALPGGAVVRVGALVDQAALSRVLAALKGS